MMFARQSMILLTLASLVAACDHGGPNALAPRVQAADAHISLAVHRPDDDTTRGNICVSRDVRSACSLTDDEAYFAFDMAYVHAQNRRVLRTLADCFVSGPLMGRQINLIGHVDPSGPRDRNASLAQRRANNVRQIIVAESTGKSALSLISSEAIDAIGTDEAPWAEDRCVDVRCVDVVLENWDSRPFNLTEN